MKIALIFPNLTHRGGNIKQVLELANYFAQKEHEVTVFTERYFDHLCFPEIKKNFKIVSLNFISSNNDLFRIYENKYLKIKLMMKKILNEDVKFDLFYIHDQTYFLLVNRIKTNFRKANFIWHLNDLPYEYDILLERESYSAIHKFFAFFLRMFDDFYIRNINHITTLSNSNALFIKRFFNKKSYVVGSGADVYFLQEKKSNKITHRKVINILTVGSFSTWRRYEDIIAAAKYLQRHLKFPKLLIKIVGTSKTNIGYYKYIVKEIKRNKLSEYIKIYQNIDNEALKRTYAKTDIYIQSTHKIGWTIPAMEAMLSGVPSIITDSCGLNEFLKNDVDAIIIEAKKPKLVAKKVIGLVNNDKLYHSISINGKKTIFNKFTWEKYCIKIENYINSL